MAGGEKINKHLEELAEEYGVKITQITFAQNLYKDYVAAPIISTLDIDHSEVSEEAPNINHSDSKTN